MNSLSRGLMACALGVALTSVYAESSLMSVQVRAAQLRATPSYLGAIVTRADYADQVTVLQSEGEWRQVKSAKDGKEGWVHISALSTKTIKLKANAQDAATTASGEEMSLAGKGFNSDVEADFKSKNADIDFGPIDRMQENTVSTDEMIRFLEEGSVKPAGGQS